LTPAGVEVRCCQTSVVSLNLLLTEPTQTPQTEERRPERFAAYIAARRFDPPRPLLIRAAGLVAPKDHALDAGAGALNATKYLLSAGFNHVTALDSSPASQSAAAELSREQVSFVLSRFEDFDYPDRAYDLVNAEFSLPFIGAPAFPSVFTMLLAAVKAGGLFTGQLFGVNDSWNQPESGMNFHSRSDVERLLLRWTILELIEEDHPGKTKLGEDKHWHIFHIIARRTA
jgi:tellurite methyltransferase